MHQGLVSQKSQGKLEVETSFLYVVQRGLSSICSVDLLVAV